MYVTNFHSIIIIFKFYNCIKGIQYIVLQEAEIFMFFLPVFLYIRKIEILSARMTPKTVAYFSASPGYPFKLFTISGWGRSITTQ